MKLVNFVRYLFIAILLFSLFFVVAGIEEALDQFTKPYCPPNMWKSGGEWGFCNFQNIRIAKAISMYLLYSSLSLLVVIVLAPRFKILGGKILLFVLNCIPVALTLYGFVFRDRFNWVTFFVTLASGLLMLLFFLITKFFINSNASVD
jgi:hypothetical protein